MNERDRAIAVLRQARDLLADRLTERILESRHAILEDAAGFGFRGDIEQLYEQLGSRLSHVNSMIANLSAGASRATSEAGRRSPFVSTLFPEGETSTDQPPHSQWERETSKPRLPALPPPRPSRGLLAPGPAGSLHPFLLHLQTGDLEGAARALAALLALDVARGRRCAAFFIRRLASEPAVLQQAAATRLDPASGDVGQTLAVLRECLGMDSAESLRAVKMLHHRSCGRPG